MKTRRRLWALVAAAVPTFSAGAAAADDPPGAPPPPPAAAPAHGRFFDTYDTNRDGKVTRDEYMAGPDAEGDVFDLLDADKDGVVTLAELGLPPDYKPTPVSKDRDDPLPDARALGRAQARERILKQIAAMDADKDGKVTRAEWKGKPATFDLLDRNHDGVISADDANVPGGPGAPGAGGMPPSPEQIAARFREQDKNGDQKISPDEFPGTQGRFKEIDKDGDGSISLEELQAAARGRPGGRIGAGFFQRLDVNKDGKLSREEFPGGDENFKRLDKDGDGFVTPAELEAGRPKDGGKGKAPGGTGAPPPPPGAPPPPPGGPTPGGEMGGDEMGGSMHGPAPAGGGIAGLFTALDRNKDGKLSREEFPGTDDEWRHLDRDHNGWITPEEAGAPSK